MWGHERGHKTLEFSKVTPLIESEHGMLRCGVSGLIPRRLEVASAPGLPHPASPRCNPPGRVEARRVQAPRGPTQCGEEAKTALSRKGWSASRTIEGLTPAVARPGYSIEITQVRFSNRCAGAPNFWRCYTWQTQALAIGLRLLGRHFIESRH